MKICTYATVFALSAITQSANSALVVVEPDDHLPGTNLSNLYPGVTLQTVKTIASSADFNYSDVFSAEAAPCSWDCTSPYFAPTGSNVFSPTSDGAGIGNGTNGWGAVGSMMNSIYAMLNGGSTVIPATVLWATFDNPTHFVSIEGLWKDGDATQLTAYDADYSIVGSVGNGFGSYDGDENDLYGTLGPLEPPNERLAFKESLTIESSTRNIAFIIAGGGVGGSGLDNLRFNAVPIPAAAWLFGSGLLGLIAVRRKR